MEPVTRHLEVVRPSPTRPTWDETWMAVADTIGKRARCVRAQHGAVIVDTSNRIVATGYNGPPAGWSWFDGPCSEGCPRAINGPKDPLAYDDCVAIHAESNALMFCDRRERDGGTIYVNGACCLTCAKNVANSGLARAVIRVNPGEDYRNPELGLTFMRQSGLEVVVV